ncbi:peptidylprolyl isomerase [Salinimicrobium sediminilitoris]|uniref:peptidylprolyl isomerase n=1 Tax=Salinimicrobium sediminilitoris TaxID=2876715 RepID=UPI001E37344A|nr:peptidylprolyl isomerase [Salinimicrobium sediminilitoris]MCC8359231.1 peptidylprolyl isomerase [Salinimicrobium sediminilitoris]
MRSKFFLILILAAAVFASCEDKKTSTQNEVETMLEEPIQPDSSRLDNTKVEEVVEAEVEQEKRKGPLLVQEELIPFLMEYAKEHDENRVRIKTRFGDIDVELFRDTPLHRANFLYMVDQDYYDGTFFHRVSEGFVIQGGNSDNPDTNKKRHRIGEFLIPSEFEAGHRHVRGALAAAKYSEQNVSKASSPYEFYIVQDPGGAPHLNNDHTVFGRVISGMDVVDEINKVPTDESEWPLRNIHIEMEIID